jgi:hypothetical protein
MTVRAPSTGEPQVEEVTVQGVRTASDPASSRVTEVEGAGLAGTEGDAAKAIEDLPGVARPSFAAGPLALWGASQGNSTTFVDGVPVPLLFHGDTVRSTVGSDLVRGVTLTPGAYGVDYGRALGGIVRIDTRDLETEGLHGRAAADLLDGSAFGEAALGERVRVAVGGRYGWLDGALHSAGWSAVDEFTAIPRYVDTQGKIDVALGEGETLDLVFLGSHDGSTEAATSTDPLRTHLQTTDTTFERFYLHYRRVTEEGEAIDVVPWVGHDSSHLVDSFGAAPALLDSSGWRAGVRASRRARVARGMLLTLGADIDGASTSVVRSGSLEIPPREGDIVAFGEPPGPDVNEDTWNVDSLGIAPYAAVDVAAGPLDLSPGLRMDAFVTTVSRRTPHVAETPSVGLSRLDAAFEPRIAARLRVTPRLAFTASAGLYSQPPAPTDLSAVFGNPNLGPARAEHATLGESLGIAPTLTADVTAFFEWMDDLAVRNPAPTPALAQALLQDGVGRSFGLQLLLRQRPAAGFAGWVSVTLSRSERRDNPTGAFRLFDQDQPVLLAVVATKSAGPWTFGARLRFASGLPRTPVVGALYDTKDDQYDPLFGAQNSIRLPNFWQLDLRIDRAFTLGRVARAFLYLEALNLTAHANAEDFAYNADYSQRGIVTGLPLLASLGARGEL